MRPNAAVSALVAMRMLFGAGAWATPRFTGRLFGLDPGHNPQAPYLGRLFGVRELALAAGTRSTEGEAQRRWLELGVLCDLADVAAALLARRREYIGPFTTVLLTAPALGAAALGVRALHSRSTYRTAA